jgi:hypothetical protein
MLGSASQFLAEFRARVVASALSIERSGFFFDHFTADVQEVACSTLASFYLYTVTANR